MRKVPNPYSELNQGQKQKLLVKALQAGDLETVEWLLKYALDVNKAVDTEGQTALAIACKSGYTEIVKKLLEKGAQPDANAGEDGPLHIACKNGHIEIVTLLLDSGAKINQHGKWGWTPLIYAAAKGNSLEIVRLLLKAGADITAIDANKENALYRMISEDNPNPEIAKLLLDNGLDIHDNNFYFGTALHWAARCGRGNIVRMLLEKGARVNLEEKRENATPIVWAMEHEHHEVIKILSAHGANPLSANRFGDSLLEYAAAAGDQDLVAEILQKINHDPHCSGAKKLYQEANALARAIQKGILEIVRLLISLGVDPNAPSSQNSETALITAAHFDKPEIVKFLLQNGADIKARDSSGNTALLHAAWCGYTAIVRLLLENGADINATNNLNWNALMQACSEGCLETARLLLENGSSLDAIDFEMGHTALTLAEHRPNKLLVDLLKSYGAKPRFIRWRLPEQGYFSIFDCDICKYLSHAFKLPSSYEPRDIEGLETIHTDIDHTDNYTDYTSILKKCKICGTYYYHYHYIDTEGAAACGVRESQNIRRYNLLTLKAALESLNLDKESAELAGRYPGLINEIEQRFGGKMLGAYIMENLIDYYLLNQDWDKLQAKFFISSNPDKGLAAICDLAVLYGGKPSDPVFPGCPEAPEARAFSREVKKAATSFIKEHLAELQTYLEQWKDHPDKRIKKLYDNAFSTTQYYRLFK